MKVNELAKELKEDSHDYAMGYLNEVADLILKQQAEIESLKEALKQIITISDRKHDAWNRAKELLNNG